MNYIAEIKKLPLNIQDILISPFGASINSEIIKKYNLNDIQAGLFMDFTNDLCLKTLKIENLETKILSDLKLPADQAHSLSLDIAGLKLLIADDYFKGEILNYLSKNNADLTGYGKKVMEEKVALEKEQAAYLDLEEKPAAKNLDNKNGAEKILKNTKAATSSKFIDIMDAVKDLEYEEKEKRAAVSLFKEDLLETLNAPADYEEIIEEYNEVLIELLRDDNFKKDLENSLYSNQEKISERKIILDGHDVEGTVSNWLKDFIKTNGSEFFSGVALAQYLSNSANIKNLNQNEKHLISQLLKLYRNLSFFPDSMGNLPLENWQIVPFDRMTQERVALKMTPPAKSVRPTKEPVAPKQNSIVKPIVKPEPIIKPEIDELAELNKEIANYPENSLEYRALKQEIEHYKKSHKGKI